MLCFPHAGGSASYYFQLSQSLSPGIEVLAVQYPGRQDRRHEPCIDSIQDLADHISGALSPWADRPLAFFGHSMGAIVAFEVARRFQGHAAAVPSRLFASGRRAPSRHRDEDIHLRDDDGVVAELRRVGGTDQRVLDDNELRAVILPVTRCDYRANETYAWAPGPLLDCPITALVGESDPHVTIDEAAAWGDHCAGEFDLRVFPGGHFYLDACMPDVIETISASVKGISRATSFKGNAS